MNPRAKFFIQWKTFEIFKDPELVTISEIYGSRKVSVKIHSEVAEWIGRKLESAKKIQVHQVGRMRKDNLVVSMQKRENSSGAYVSLLFVSPNIKKGSATLCIPEDNDQEGWNLFSTELKKIMGTPTPPICATPMIVEPMGGINHLIVKEGFDGREDILRKNGILLTMENVDKWSEVPDVMKNLFNISGKPQIFPIGHKTYVLICESEKDVETMTHVQKLELMEGEICLRRWTPKVATLAGSWLHRKDRWVELEGIPLHLRDDKLIVELCKPFGKVIKVEMVDNRGLGL